MDKKVNLSEFSAIKREVDLSLDTKNTVIKIKKWLTLDEFIKFTSEFEDFCFINESYTPAIGLTRFKVALVEYYTNIELPESPSEAYDLIVSLNLDEKVLSVIGQSQQYMDLVSAITKRLEFDKEQKLGSNCFSNLLSALITDFLKTDLANSEKNLKEILTALNDKNK